MTDNARAGLTETEIRERIRADRRTRKTEWASDVISDNHPVSGEESAIYRAGYAAGERAGEARQQAKIDALMLEFCPDEMTPEQLTRWEAHQRAAKGE